MASTPHSRSKQISTIARLLAQWRSALLREGLLPSIALWASQDWNSPLGRTIFTFVELLRGEHHASDEPMSYGCESTQWLQFCLANFFSRKHMCRDLQASKVQMILTKLLWMQVHKYKLKINKLWKCWPTCRIRRRWRWPLGQYMFTTYACPKRPLCIEIL